MYKALYRKWRPKSFDDVIGQEAITTTLKNEVASGKIAHAYLFTGSRGTGKTTCSKILSKAVNCPNQKDGNPCMVCDVCKGIDDGSILDVVEIDAASNNGVENVRNLRDEAVFTPASVKYRVYIIDEAHMLSQGAANALLKIMEEPPAHVIFILATTEVHKLPATILSRCQRFDFKRVDTQVIANRLQYIAEQEQIILDPQAAELIAKLADGGVRDALSLLDTCISRNTNIDLQVVGEVAGIVGQNYLFDLADAICQKDPTKALEIVKEIHHNAVDSDRLCHQMIQHYRNLMVAKSSKDPSNLILAMPEELEKIKKQSANYSMEELFFAIDTFSNAVAKLSRTAYREAEIEMCVIKLCLRDNGEFAESLSVRLDKLEAKVAAFIANGITQQPLSETAPRKSKIVKTSSLEARQDTMPSHLTTKKEMSSLSDAEEIPFENWDKVLKKLLTKNPPLYGALIQSKAYIKGDIVLIDCQEPLFLEMIRNNEYTKKALRETISEITGKKFRLGPYKRAIQQKVIDDPLDDIIKNVESLKTQEEL